MAIAPNPSDEARRDAVSVRRAMSDFPLLFSPALLGGVALDNRVVRAPLSTWRANRDGTVSERTIRHYARYAAGGVGLVMTEYVYVDDKASKGTVCQLGASSDEHVPGLAWLAGAIQAEGARAGIQLVHTGRQSETARPPLAPSALAWEHGDLPEALTEEEIGTLVADFAAAARRSAQAGFDVVEVHAAHGYLLQQFLSPHANRRDDGYGGSEPARRRIVEEVVRAVRAAAPAPTAVTVRVGWSDFRPDGFGIEETLRLCQALERLGVDAIHVSGGDHGTGHMQWSPMAVPPAPHAAATRRVKDAVSVPVIASGSILTPQRGEELLGSGVADFVALGRPLLADADWAVKARAGRADEIRPCIRCNDGCIVRSAQRFRSITCSVNPLVEDERALAIRPAAARRSVVVVGGGPAGMVSALVAAARGHEVALHERHTLGGALNDSDKPELRAYRDYLVRSLAASRVRVVLEPPSDEALARGVLIVATGGTQQPPPWQAAAGVAVVDAVALRPADVAGRHLALVGDSYAAVEAALRVAPAAAAVTLLSEGPALPDRERTERIADLERLTDSGVRVRTDARVIGMAGDELLLEDGRLRVDVVGLGLPRRPGAPMADAQGRPPAHVVGDARAPGKVHDAVHGGHRAGRLV